MNGARVWPAVAVAVTASAGCPPAHVEIRAPSPNLSPDERVATFESLKPLDQRFVSVSRDGGNTWDLTSTSLLLANKTEVSAPEDLLPVVSPDSETAKAARASGAARTKAWIATGFFLASGAGGYELTGHFGSDARPWGVNPYAAWSVMILGPIIGYIIEHHYEHVDLTERRYAFAHYTRDLGDRLNVCASGLQVVPCDQPPPSPPPTAPPARTAPQGTRWEQAMRFPR